MSGRENNPGEDAGELFQREKLRFALWRINMVCIEARKQAVKIDGSMGFLGQLIEMMAELTRVTEAFREETEAYALARLTRGRGKFVDEDFGKLTKAEEQATILQWELTYKIWDLCDRHGKIGELIRHDLDALKMYKGSSDKR